MQNRLNLEPPQEELARIRELAYDLAYGRTVDIWGKKIHLEVNRAADTVEGIYFADFDKEGALAFEDYLERKWQKNYPGFPNLADHGFVHGGAISTSTDEWELTSLAFNLLYQVQSTNTSVFISYKRETSSPFALLIESRLRELGIEAFVDRAIPGGDDWHGELEKRVKTSPVFVCVIAPATLESPWVQKEIQWAEENLRIAVLDYNYQYESDEKKENIPQPVKDFMERKQWISVKGYSAEDYHIAVERLINDIRLRTG